MFSHHVVNLMKIPSNVPWVSTMNCKSMLSMTSQIFMKTYASKVDSRNFNMVESLLHMDIFGFKRPYVTPMECFIFCVIELARIMQRGSFPFYAEWDLQTQIHQLSMHCSGCNDESHPFSLMYALWFSSILSFLFVFCLPIFLSNFSILSHNFLNFVHFLSMSISPFFSIALYSPTYSSCQFFLFPWSICPNSLIQA